MKIKEATHVKEKQHYKSWNLRGCCENVLREFEERERSLTCEMQVRQSFVNERWRVECS